MKSVSSFLLISVFCTVVIASEMCLAQSSRALIAEPEWKAQLKEKEAKRNSFAAHVDSLFNESRFEDLIQYTNWKIEHTTNSWEARQVMMSAFYFLGNYAASDELFVELMNAEGLPNTPFEMNNSSLVPLIKYFEIAPNREKLLNHILQKYGLENHPNTALGLQLLKYYLNDQWIRRNNSKMESMNPNFEKENQKQLDEIFAFYQSRGGLATPEEVGSSVFYYQFILLCHEHDMERRAIYLPMVKAAVKAGHCTVHREINFILRTEQMKKGKAFFDDYDNIVAEIGKQYGMPDFFYSIY